MTDDLATIVLPIVDVQQDFQNVISDVQDGLGDEDFWISCYRTGSESIHGKVRVSKEGNGVDLTSRLGVLFERGQQASHTVSCPELSIGPTRIRVPRRVIRDTDNPHPARPRQINAFDVSPDLSQIAVGFNDGSIQRRVISSSSTGVQTHTAVTYRPHVSSITSLRFFPSSKVLLAAAADFALTVLDADAASSPNINTAPARMLKGHSRAITDSAIVARGKNVISCAKDGTLRLWDVSAGKQIKLMGSTRYSPILKMSLGSKSNETGYIPPNGDVKNADSGRTIVDEREVETQDKLVFCALQDGTFEAFDLGSKSSIFHSGKEIRENAKGALASIVYSSSHNWLATGSIRGIVTLYDTRNLTTPITSFSRNGSSIEDLAFTDIPAPSRPNPSESESTHAASSQSTVGLVVATEDGLPYLARVGPNGPEIEAELIGGDCEAVRVVRVDPMGGIWTAGDDGAVRLF